MLNQFKKYIFPSLIALSALSISASAAYYSVYGLSRLFSGAALAIIIMAGALEISKLVIASSLHRYWTTLNKWLKTYLIIALVSLMSITSAGIYGFLTSAYQETSSKSKVVEKEILLIENKKKQFYNSITRDSTTIVTKNKRVLSLTELRQQQETRLDSLYQKGWYNSARQTETIIKEANEDLKTLEFEIDTLNLSISSYNDSLTVLDKQIFEAQLNNEAAAELGPLKYVAELTGKSMDTVINWFMLLLIFVFDPLAIALVIAANFAFSSIGYKKIEEIELEIDEDEWEDNQEESDTIEETTENLEESDVSESSKYPNLYPKDEIEKLQREKEKIINSSLSTRKRIKEINKIDNKIKEHLSNSDNIITY